MSLFGKIIIKLYYLQQYILGFDRKKRITLELQYIWQEDMSFLKALSFFIAPPKKI